jgi:hypothetical protein
MNSFKPTHLEHYFLTGSKCYSELGVFLMFFARKENEKQGVAYVFKPSKSSLNRLYALVDLDLRDRDGRVKDLDISIMNQQYMIFSPKSPHIHQNSTEMYLLNLQTKKHIFQPVRLTQNHQTSIEILSSTEHFLKENIGIEINQLNKWSSNKRIIDTELEMNKFLDMSDIFKINCHLSKITNLNNTIPEDLIEIREPFTLIKDYQKNSMIKEDFDQVKITEDRDQSRTEGVLLGFYFDKGNSTTRIFWTRKTALFEEINQLDLENDECLRFSTATNVNYITAAFVCKGAYKTELKFVVISQKTNKLVAHELFDLGEIVKVNLFSGINPGEFFMIYKNDVLNEVGVGMISIDQAHSDHITSSSLNDEIFKVRLHHIGTINNGIFPL